MNKTLRKWTLLATPMYGGSASMNKIDVMHAQKQNLWTNHFAWASHVNDCKEWRLHANAVKPLSHEVSSQEVSSLLIHELLWDSARPVLMHTSSVIAVPDLLILMTERTRSLLIFHSTRLEKIIDCWRCTLLGCRYGLARVSWSLY